MPAVDNRRGNRLLSGLRVQPVTTGGSVEWARRLEAAGVFGGPDEENRQLAWYAAHRKRIYRNVGVRNCGRALEIGCGTGGLTGELDGRVSEYAVGIDVRAEALAYAVKNREGKYVAACASALPFGEGAFDAVTFAFTVMWLAEPGAVFAEARRVTRDGGRLLVFAEPDYYSLVDEPSEASSKEEAIGALVGYGADPGVGTKVGEYVRDAGFKNVSVGTLDASWPQECLEEEEEAEMGSLRRLLAATVSERRIDGIAAARRSALEEGIRSYSLPIYYLTATR
jgi:SAM-dependent methyltransferase